MCWSCGSKVMLQAERACECVAILLHSYDDERYWSMWRRGGLYDGALLFYNLVAAKTVVFNMTQPLLSSGQLKWAINNVAMPSNPPCTPVLDLWAADRSWVRAHTAPADSSAQITASNNIMQVLEGPS
jgi:hypothetical protein